MGIERREIMEVKTFVDADGREIKEFTQVFGKSKDSTFYKGRAQMRVQPMNQNGMPMQPQMIPFEFLFPDGTNLKKAFELFDETAKSEVEAHTKDMKEKAAANRIVTASSVPSILGVNGKPMAKG